MQDRFKFRVWSIANKKYCHFATMDLSADGLLRVIRPLERREYIADYENRYVIQQCTGLKDKNGKLIYEGDVVKFNYDTDEIKAVVSWGDIELIGFYLNTTDYFKDKYVTDYDFYKNDYEVLGNIYENPELLED